MEDADRLLRQLHEINVTVQQLDRRMDYLAKIDTSLDRLRGIESSLDRLKGIEDYLGSIKIEFEIVGAVVALAVGTLMYRMLGW